MIILFCEQCGKSLLKIACWYVSYLHFPALLAFSFSIYVERPSSLPRYKIQKQNNILKNLQIGTSTIYIVKLLLWPLREILSGT